MGTPYTISLQEREKDTDLIGKLSKDGGGVRHPEKDHMVTKNTVSEPPKTAPRIIKKRSCTERAKLTGHD